MANVAICIQRGGNIEHCAAMSVCVKACLRALWSWCHIESSCSHVGAADGLYLLHAAELGFGQQLQTHEGKKVTHAEVGNDSSLPNTAPLSA